LISASAAIKVKMTSKEIFRRKATSRLISIAQR